MNDTPNATKTQYDRLRDLIDSATDNHNRNRPVTANFILESVKARALVDIAESLTAIARNTYGIDHSLAR